MDRALFWYSIALNSLYKIKVSEGTAVSFWEPQKGKKKKMGGWGGEVGNKTLEEDLEDLKQ